MTLRFALLVLAVLAMVGASCDQKSSNLTQPTKISEALETLATPSAMLSDCLAKNSVAGAGGNTKNCDDVMRLYITEWERTHPKK